LMPEFTDYSMKGRTYRYFEHEPLYPFGYGLTYGDVSVQEAKAETDGERIIVRARVKNDGGADTQDVVQVYIQNEESPNAPANARLCGFSRVNCLAGQTIETTIEIEKKRLLVVNDQGEFVSEGKPVLFVGVNQPDERSLALTGHACVRIAL